MGNIKQECNKRISAFQKGEKDRKSNNYSPPKEKALRKAYKNGYNSKI